MTTDELERQVGAARLAIAADGYPMSIGEITSMYRDGELIIRPEFQRLFRWSNGQKSRLIESILLGIPLPSIFVAQTDDGKWELVDGLQRVSTILQLQNELRGPDGSQAPALKLEATKYLPFLEGRSWDGPAGFPVALRLDIKRSKVDVKILRRESSQQAKFDLFQRLNNFGSALTAQEMRNALLVGASPVFFAWLQALRRERPFAETVSLTDSAEEEQYGLELVLRFLVLHNRPENLLSANKLKDFSEILDSESVALAMRHPEGAEALAETFRKTFEVISENGGPDVFRRWNAAKGSFAGSFLNTAFEVFGLGLGYRVANKLPFRKDLLTAAQEFWQRTATGFATGRSTETRMAQFIPEGRILLEPVRPPSSSRRARR